MTADPVTTPTRCPCCHRRFRRPKAAETPEQAAVRIRTEARTRVAAGLRKPMPKGTVYR